MSVKAIASIVAAVALAALVSFLVGRSGTSVDRDLFATVQLRSQLVEARGQVLDGRISLYLVNFGDASRHFSFAKGPLASARVALEARGRGELVTKLDQASKELDAAQDLATRLSQDANGRAGEAARLLNDIVQAVGGQ